MDMQELLKARGLGDELIKGITEDMKANKLFITNEENLDIRYGKLKTEHENLTAQHGESTKLIEQLKASAKDNETMQGKITSYEATIADLQKKNDELRVEAAMDRKLTAAGAKTSDLDYLKFQWRKKGEITLDDNGEIKGGDDAIAGMKVQFAAQFDSVVNGKEVTEQRLPTRNAANVATVTKEQFNNMGYNSRVELKKANPELYEQLSK